MYDVYKCATSGEYFSKVKVQLNPNSLLPVSKVCSDDPRNYQSCGLVRSTKIINSAIILCDEVICQTEVSGYNVTYNHDLQQECFDMANSIAPPSLCNPLLNQTSCQTFSSKLYNYNAERPIKCDMICQNRTTCIDEVACNGFTYGLFCLKNGLRKYVKISKICDQISDCDNFVDELKCKADLSVPTKDLCYKTYHSLGIRIENFTRCGPLEMINSGKKRSYCMNYMDQVNCSDPWRGVLRCEVSGFPSTVSSGALCQNGLTLCDDGLDAQCKQTSPLCFIHKHLLCNGVEDCKDASDEHGRHCESVLEAKCLRRSVYLFLDKYLNK